ncbi:uncharacterized protein LOC119334089 [Triticum dicoccoides]|uniref:uncharacterized protein LOC119334089 n=1 Tax=Triticum dicoccoides TaxID=85692 RepID=UPI0018916DE1|nr:uncharacterized protein LOC119334089 [Triticum dicoccoides]
MQVNTAKLPYTQSNLWMHASVERKLLADWLLEPGVGPLEWQLPEPVAPTVAGVDVSPSLILLVPYSSPITEQEEIHVEVGQPRGAEQSRAAPAPTPAAAVAQGKGKVLTQQAPAPVVCKRKSRRRRQKQKSPPPAATREELESRESPESPLKVLALPAPGAPLAHAFSNDKMMDGNEMKPVQGVPPMWGSIAASSLVGKYSILVFCQYHG